jgi:hypothetical protein
MAGVLYPEEQPGILSQPATVNPILLRQIQAQRASNPRPNVTDIFGYGPDLNSYASNLSRNFAGQFEGLGTPQNFMGPFGFGGITAFHGSPHKFDKFDMSKVGTGEGAQAYGHGLYFAENPKVAGGYASGLGKVEIEGKPMDWSNPAHVAAYEVHLKGDMAKAADHLYRAAQQRVHSSSPDVAMRASQMLDEILTNKGIRKADRLGQLPQVKQGNLYKVDIPDDQVAKMLDWDKPLSQQPEIFKKINKGIKEGEGRWFGSITGASLHTGLRNKALTYDGNPVNEIFRKLGKGANQDEAVRLYLNSIGIPGIRYLDQGSRSGGKGTSNFVVFDDQIPKIIGRE